MRRMTTTNWLINVELYSEEFQADLTLSLIYPLLRKSEKSSRITEHSFFILTVIRNIIE